MIAYLVYSLHVGIYIHTSIHPYIHPSIHPYIHIYIYIEMHINIIVNMVYIGNRMNIFFYLNGGAPPTNTCRVELSKAMPPNTG